MPSADIWASRYRNAKSWEDSTRIIMLASKSLPVLPESLRSDNLEIRGCESRVWLDLDLSDGISHLRGYSDGKIVRGLIQLITEPLQGLSEFEFSQFDIDHHLTSLHFEQYLSPSRSNGVSAMVSRLKAEQGRH